jgi:hypothetical protein
MALIPLNRLILPYLQRQDTTRRLGQPYLPSYSPL